MRPPDRDDAYVPLEAPDILPLLSWLFFAASLASKPLVRLLPRSLRPYPWGVLLPVAASAALALVGVLLAWVGGRRARRPGIARIGLFLNATVFGLTLLAGLAIAWILRRVR